MDPAIMLFDEPTTGLDPIIGQTIVTTFNSAISGSNLPGIIVTHRGSKVL